MTTRGSWSWMDGMCVTVLTTNAQDVTSLVTAAAQENVAKRVDGTDKLSTLMWKSKEQTLKCISLDHHQDQ